MPTYRRFTTVLCRFIHFTDNNDERAKMDRAWKIRSLSDTLQETFPNMYTLGKWISFDEAVLPGRGSLHSFLMYFKVAIMIIFDILITYVI